ncbi:MAG: hypothetical protein JWL76_1468 [Thermoleophilia bacterium]|nr:hypothetical protein [Thermoleophilia bacterium]
MSDVPEEHSAGPASEMLTGLFENARRADEFEYACALLRVRGLEDAGWDPLQESWALYQDIGDTLETATGLSQIRLGLLLYCHVTEVDAMYITLHNLMVIASGGRYSMDPFYDLYQPANRPRFRQRPPSANQVVNRLREKGEELGMQEVPQAVDAYFNSQLRNAFFHSDYILAGGEFRSREARFEREGIMVSSLPLDEVARLINGSLKFFETFMVTMDAMRRAYAEDKVVAGRLGGDDQSIPVTLLADQVRGLYGFRA